jgi:hypothetical protein
MALSDTRTSHLPSRQDRTFVPSAGTGAVEAEGEGEGVALTLGATGADAGGDDWLVTGEADEHPPSSVSSRTGRHRDRDRVMPGIPAPSSERERRLAAIGHRR